MLSGHQNLNPTIFLQLISQKEKEKTGVVSSTRFHHQRLLALVLDRQHRMMEKEKGRRKVETVQKFGT